MATKIIDGESLAADIDQDDGDSIGVFLAKRTDLMAFDFDTTGASTAVGDFKLMHSPDYNPVTKVGSWHTIDGGTTLLAINASAVKDCVHYRGGAGWYKVWYDRTSDGTAETATVYVTFGDRG